MIDTIAQRPTSVRRIPPGPVPAQGERPVLNSFSSTRRPSCRTTSSAPNAWRRPTWPAGSTGSRGNTRSSSIRDSARSLARLPQAAVHCSAAFERHRRSLSAMRRELFRTLDAPGKMRKAELGTPNEQGVTDVANPPAATSDAEEVAEVMEAGADEEPDLPESVTMPEKVARTNPICNRRKLRLQRQLNQKTRFRSRGNEPNSRRSSSLSRREPGVGLKRLCRLSREARRLRVTRRTGESLQSLQHSLPGIETRCLPCGRNPS